MAKYISDTVLDTPCQYLEDNVTHLYITSAQASTYTEAITTYALGNKATPTFTGPANGDVSGRKTTVDAITDGTVTADGTASHFALVDADTTALLAAGPLGATQAVTSGNTFTLGATDVEFPDPA
jgi:hypothetical protein